MKRKFLRRFLIGFFILITVWLVFAQRTMKVRMSESDAKAKSVEVKILKGARHFIPWEQYGDIKEVLMRLTE